MYAELYSAWQKEVAGSELGALPPDFYARIASYLKRIKEENGLLDKKTIKASLLDHEAQHVKRMLEELVWLRYKKLLKLVTKSQQVPSELLSAEEVQIIEGFLPFAESYRNFAKSLLQGQAVKTDVDVEVTHKRVTLRFLKTIPSVIGADMKTYGPFNPEDVASLPIENARVFVKQNLAVIVEVS
jgi:DNA replication factor GINS